MSGRMRFDLKKTNLEDLLDDVELGLGVLVAVVVQLLHVVHETFVHLLRLDTFSKSTIIYH